jgi:exopolyphosphatase/guanosine-5'-triphosphate,3'-diphosphate pyrophosphatase
MSRSLTATHVPCCACIDIGSNTTRLLVAQANGTRLQELLSERAFTHLGVATADGCPVGPDKIDEVAAVVARQVRLAEELGAASLRVVATAAVRQAVDRTALAAAIEAACGARLEILAPADEARLAFGGAIGMLLEAPAGLIGVVDVGGGSTELVVGLDGEVAFHVSTQAGVVRQTERHLHADPPTPAQLQALRAEAADTFTAAVPPDVRAQVQAGVAVAGTATSGAAMLQRLERYDSARVHGFVLRREAVETLLRRVGQMTEAQRRRLPGLHPDRAGVIVAGLALQLEAMRAFGLDAVEVSEHDLMRGAALELAAHRRRRRDDAGTGVG